MSLGGGNGALAHLLAEEGYRIDGVDASQSGIGPPRHDPAGAVFHHDLIEAGRVARMDRSHRFDLVLSSEALEHLYRPGDLLEAALFPVRPGGWLGEMDLHLNPAREGGHRTFFGVKTIRDVRETYGFLIQGFFAGVFRASG